MSATKVPTHYVLTIDGAPETHDTRDEAKAAFVQACSEGCTTDITLDEIRRIGYAKNGVEIVAAPRASRTSKDD